MLEAAMVQQTPAAKRWTAIIDEQETSGQTIRAFAERRGLNVKTLSWWRCQLGRSRPQKRLKRSPTPDTQSFVEVNVDVPSVEGTVVIAFEHIDAHIVVDQDTDLALLRAVLGALC
jgi:hypothetical protein